MSYICAMKLPSTRLVSAVILSPILAVLLIFGTPEYLSADESTSATRFALVYFSILGILSSILLGLPLSKLLRDKRQDGYWQYALAGLIPPAYYLYVMFGMSGKRALYWQLIPYLLCGVVAAVIFRWIRGGVCDDDGPQEKALSK